MKKEKPNGKCVMCNVQKESGKIRTTGEKVVFYFIDPQTNEQLCEKCNRVNDSIYMGDGKNLRGISKVEEKGK